MVTEVTLYSSEYEESFSEHREHSASEINAEEFYANDLLAAFSACGVIAKEKEDVLTKIISEAWKRNLNYKTSFAERVENKIKGAINP